MTGLWQVLDQWYWNVPGFLSQIIMAIFYRSLDKLGSDPMKFSAIDGDMTECNNGTVDVDIDT